MAGWLARGAAALSAAASLLLGCGARTAPFELAPTAGGGRSAGTGASAGSTGACADTRTDAANCGACGTVCAGTCTAGRCLVKLASEQMNVGCIALDAEHVYWATADLPAHGAINRIPREGGIFSTISTTTTAPWPCTMAVDAMFVYWADGSNGSVLKARVRGGVALTLAAGAANANYIAIDSANLYWTGQFGYPTKLSLGGGGATRLADSYSANGVALDATSLYWTVRGAGNMGGSVQKVALSGGMPTTLATGQGLPERIAVDESSVYWTNDQAGTIQKISRAGGAIVSLASGQFNPSVIAVDEASVYWSTSLGSLMKVAKTGGTPTLLANSTAFDLALDATSVYWTDGSAVLKLTPK